MNNYKFCMACGNKLHPDDVYCQECGVKVGQIDKSPSIEEPQPQYCHSCGSVLGDGDIFCSNCGYKNVETAEKSVPPFKDYKNKIDDLKQEYDVKEQKANNLITEIFNASKMSNNHFMESLNKCTVLFDSQVDISLKIIELANEESYNLKKELDSKIDLMESIIDGLDDLTEELIIHLASNRKNNEEIENVLGDMKTLIDSVKDY